MYRMPYLMPDVGMVCDTHYNRGCPPYGRDGHHHYTSDHATNGTGLLLNRINYDYIKQAFFHGSSVA